MRKIQLRVVPTGRDWGDKVDEVKTKVKAGKTSITYIENDVWEGPYSLEGDGAKGQYYRNEYIILPDIIDKRFKD